CAFLPSPPHRRMTRSTSVTVTTEVVPFRATDQPTNLAPRCARGSMLRPMSALDLQAWGAALSHPLSRQLKEAERSQPELRTNQHQGSHQAFRIAAAIALPVSARPRRPQAVCQ